MGLFMSDLQTSLPATLALPASTATISRCPPTALYTCLVVSISPRQAQLLVRGAHEDQWATIVCNSADDALRQTVWHRVHLALVDLQTASRGQEISLRDLVEQLAKQSGPLVAVCGKPDDTSGEVWSRQRGVWMYLPGVDGQSDIALLCGEARSILEKLAGRDAPAVT
jgi:hypothetical protein